MGESSSRFILIIGSTRPPLYLQLARYEVSQVVSCSRYEYIVYSYDAHTHERVEPPCVFCFHLPTGSEQIPLTWNESSFAFTLFVVVDLTSRRQGSGSKPSNWFLTAGRVKSESSTQSNLVVFVFFNSEGSLSINISFLTREREREVR